MYGSQGQWYADNPGGGISLAYWECDAVLASDAVSPLHAVLKRQGKAVFITDQESSAGTFHNDERLTPWASVRLKDGDLVAFGDVRYVVEIDLD